ncbi:barstar family protein [Streptomyces huasconensis]|uniref:barstar family protein n=1 Tax=Streptomyces huasconensis TaxID=1854574 RepID=UPI0033F6A74C
MAGMAGFDVTGTSAPWVVFVPRGTAEVQRQLSALEARGGQVHHFASSDLMTERGVHRAFAKALRFPGGYGGNWDALVDCLDDLCGAVTGGVGVAGVIHAADGLLTAEHFPLLVSVLCQGADRANAAVDLDGFPLDRPAMPTHFVFELDDFGGFGAARVADLVRQPDLVVTAGDRFVAAELDPAEWH